MDNSQGPIRIPIGTDLQFQRAFSASFGTLASDSENDERFSTSYEAPYK